MGLLLGSAWVPALVWLVMAHPDRRPESASGRVIAILTSVGVLGSALVRTITFQPTSHGCTTCPRNLLLVADLPTIAVVAGACGQLVTLAACVAASGQVGGNLVRASAAARLRRAPVAVAGIAALGVCAVGSLLGVAVTASARAGAQAVADAQALTVLALAVVASWGPVRARTARRRAVRLLADLTLAPQPGQLREKLVELTGDKTLAIAFVLDDGALVDGQGGALLDPRTADAQTHHTTVIGADGRPVAVLSHRPGVLDDPDFREPALRTVALAFGHERLQAELAARVTELRQSRARLVDTFDTERRRLERDLHDGAQQGAVALLLALRLALATHHRPELAGAIAETESALAELRDLAHGLYPAALAEEGLASALDALRLDAIDAVRLGAVPPGRYPPGVETTTYAVVVGSLALGIRSPTVDVRDEGTALRIRVAGTLEERYRPERLVGVQDRVGSAGGTVHATTDGPSVAVEAVVPCAW